jgi:hypothetical protein
MKALSCIFEEPSYGLAWQGACNVGTPKESKTIAHFTLFEGPQTTPIDSFATCLMAKQKRTHNLRG